MADVCILPPDGWACTRRPGHEGPCAAVPMGQPAVVDSALLDHLETLLAKSEGQYSKLPWRVLASDGKPIIAGTKHGGNLFRGFIATWPEADLACAAVNSLPVLIKALRDAEEPEPHWTERRFVPMAVAALASIVGLLIAITVL
jgi:hypothetical protein